MANPIPRKIVFGDGGGVKPMLIPHVNANTNWQHRHHVADEKEVEASMIIDVDEHESSNSYDHPQP